MFVEGLPYRDILTAGDFNFICDVVCLVFSWKVSCLPEVLDTIFNGKL